MSELLREEVPPLGADLATVAVAFGQLGRDFNGSLLYSDRVAWLDDRGIVDRGEREAYHRLWDQAEAERSAYLEEQREAAKEN